MDPLVVGLLVIIATVVVFLIGRMVLFNKRTKTAETWPTTEATVQSGEETIASTRGGDVTIYSFTFSYFVNGEYYSGRFELLPNSDPVDGVLSRMKDRKFQIHYDRAKPESYYVPDEQMEDCDVNNC